MALEEHQRDDRLRIGISRCLLGEEVRHDGGHKHDTFLTDTLGQWVEWVPICPEVEIGLGTPRPAMRLVASGTGPLLKVRSTGEDLTKVILTQIILEEEKGQRNLLPVEFLHELIKYGESTSGDFLRSFLSSGFDAYKQAQEQMTSAFRNWMPPGWPGPQAPQPSKSGSRPPFARYMSQKPHPSGRDQSHCRLSRLFLLTLSCIDIIT